jgi:hypothetical protein
MTILNAENPAHAAAGRLRAEPIIWLTTVTRSGQPQSTPVWFLWRPVSFAEDYLHRLLVSPTRARIW